MPGRTIPDAYEAFIEPIQQGLACIGRAKITASPNGRHDPAGEHAWSINNNAGLRLPAGVHLQAGMKYRFVRCKPPEEHLWRVSTLAYRYAVNVQDVEVIAWHWHPSGQSHVTEPHIHVPRSVMEAGQMVSAHAHIPS